MIDSFLSALDAGTIGALWRASLGAALTCTLAALLPGAGAGVALASLAVLLFAVKAVAAVGRRLVRSPAVHAQWTLRRAYAVDFDSYQWRKLVWFGLGMLAACALLGSRPPWAIPVGLGCLAAGVAGELAWRRAGVTTAPPTRP